MPDLTSATPERLATLRTELEQRYDAFKARGLALDMTRGKPSAAQLDLAVDLLTLPGAGDFKTAAGVDGRNYGGLEGIPELREIFSAMLEVPADRILIGGNSSLTMMHDVIVRALLKGVPGGETPWGKLHEVKMLCPCPGYDRHFSICERFGIEMITVPMNADGPDMDAVEELVGEDGFIKGIWCVPKYSNPTGVTFSDAVVDRLASMKTAAPDFRIIWDNAYAEHHLGANPDPLKEILAACAAAGNPDRALVFASTSKISFAGSGVSAMAASADNIADQKKHLSMQTIGPDKINQLRHVRFFGNIDGVRAHMQKHAAILKPKFDAVDALFTKELGDSGVAVWSKPNGGYFVNLDVLDGTATETVRLAGECGVKLTGAGATFPYKKDPNDRNIRIAPSLPPLEEVETAMAVVAVCALLTAVQKLAEG